MRVAVVSVIRLCFGAIDGEEANRQDAKIAKEKTVRGRKKES
jgi:hypothetical protein